MARTGKPATSLKSMAAGGVRLTYLELTAVSHFPWAGLGSAFRRIEASHFCFRFGWANWGMVDFCSFCLLAYGPSYCLLFFGMQVMSGAAINPLMLKHFCDLTLSACWFPVWSLVVCDYTRNVLYKEPSNVQSAIGDSHLEQHWIPSFREVLEVGSS